MKIAAGTLFLGLSVFLNSFEPICSQPPPGPAEHTTLLNLFPESYGVHFPDIKKLGPEDVESIPNFTQLNGRRMSQRAPIYLKRGHVIFGYTENNNIEVLGKLFDQPSVSAVFETIRQKWYTLNEDELEQLGANRSLQLVTAHDEIHADFHELYHPSNAAVHNAACKYAYDKTRINEDIVRLDEEEPIVDSDKRIAEIKRHYTKQYFKEYRRRMRRISGGR